MNITHISISRKSVWDQCQVCYRYKYHLQVPSPEEEPFYFAYGKVIHKIAEEYVSAAGSRKLGDVATDVLSGKISLERDQNGVDVLAPKLPAEYKARMPEHLRSIKILTDKIGFGGILEHPFHYDLDGEGRHIKGFIDRLIRRGDKYFILDYKTTKRGPYRKTFDTITSDLQLRAYARVVQKEFNVAAKDIKAALYYVEGGNLVAASFSQDSLDMAEQELLQAYKDIVNTPAENARPSVGQHCKRCDYRSICPFFRNQNQYDYADAISITSHLFN